MQKNHTSTPLGVTKEEMIKKRKPKKVLILGSGALQIGQAVNINPELISGSQSKTEDAETSLPDDRQVQHKK